MLASFLKSISNDYLISFETDSINRQMIIRVEKGIIRKKAIVEYECLSYEERIISAIKDAIDKIERGKNDG